MLSFLSIGILKIPQKTYSFEKASLFLRELRSIILQLLKIGELPDQKKVPIPVIPEINARVA